jgi:hypothetical protein
MAYNRYKTARMVVKISKNLIKMDLLGLKNSFEGSYLYLKSLDMA